MDTGSSIQTELLPRDLGESDKVKSENQGTTIHVIQVSEESLRNIIQETVQETMTRFGMTWNSPLDMQKDFNHLREWRETMDFMKRKTILTIWTTVITGSAAALWMGIKSALAKGN